MAKETIVVLECPSLGSREFGIEHAENLLNMQHNGGWHLPKDSEYEFVDGTINRRSQKKGK